MTRQSRGRISYLFASGIALAATAIGLAFMSSRADSPVEANSQVTPPSVAASAQQPAPLIRFSTLAETGDDVRHFQDVAELRDLSKLAGLESPGCQKTPSVCIATKVLSEYEGLARKFLERRDQIPLDFGPKLAGAPSLDLPPRERSPRSISFAAIEKLQLPDSSLDTYLARSGYSESKTPWSLSAVAFNDGSRIIRSHDKALPVYRHGQGPVFATESSSLSIETFKDGQREYSLTISDADGGSLVVSPPNRVRTGLDSNGEVDSCVISGYGLLRAWQPEVLTIPKESSLYARCATLITDFEKASATFGPKSLQYTHVKWYRDVVMSRILTFNKVLENYWLRQTR
jgi:hypothetical protein